MAWGRSQDLVGLILHFAPLTGACPGLRKGGSRNITLPHRRGNPSSLGELLPPHQSECTPSTTHSLIANNLPGWLLERTLHYRRLSTVIVCITLSTLGVSEGCVGLLGGNFWGRKPELLPQSHWFCSTCGLPLWMASKGN